MFYYGKLFCYTKLYILKSTLYIQAKNVTEQNTLREIEKKTYMSYHQDGLLDIVIGLYALAFGLGIVADQILDINFAVIYPGIMIAIVLPIWIAAKRKITMPRIGYVNIGTKGSNKIFALFLGLAVAGLGVFFLFTMMTFQNGRPEWIETILFQYGMVWIGLGAAVIGSMFAFTMGLKRLYGYGLLTLALFVVGYFLAVPFEYLLLFIGGVVMACGVALLVQFIHKYPLQKGASDNAVQ